MRSLPHTSTWNVTEMPPDASRGHAWSIDNTEPHMLRQIVAPHRRTHRITSAQRRRASCGPSFLRLVLDPLHEAGAPLVVHAVLVTLPLTAVAS